ncbi:hypothetical protein B0H13DRAFT_758747 [Mycena leptocephala]|nr:hypothetical protein B0H13DRAFT_758747 [Mycena leptocephala]
MYALRRLPNLVLSARAACGRPFLSIHLRRLYRRRTQLRPQAERFVLAGPGLQAPEPGEPVKELPTSSPSRKPVYADFHRTTLDIAPYSTDWEDTYSGSPECFFKVPSHWHDLTEIDFHVKRVFGIRGTVRPIAFKPLCEPCVLFEAGGEYYCITLVETVLVRYGGDFTGPDDFLKRRSSIEPVVEEFPDDYEEKYAATCDEQERLLMRADKWL